VFGSGANAFEVRTTISGCTFRGNQSPRGNGGAVASVPGLIYSIPERTVASTAVSVTRSTFARHRAGGDGGGIYLDSSTATSGSNTYGGNQATEGPSLSGTHSIINGDPTSPVIQ